MLDSAELISEIYSAAVDPTHWPEVMATLAEGACAQAIALSAEPRDESPARILCAVGLSAAARASFEREFAAKSPWRMANLAVRPGELLPDQYLDPFRPRNGALHGTRFYRDWMRPQGFKHALGGRLLDNGAICFQLSLFRSRAAAFSRKDARQLEPLVRHLARALDISHRLELFDLELRASLSTLTHTGCPAVFITRDCEVTFVTPMAEEILDTGRVLQIVNDRLRATEPAYEAPLEHLIRQTVAASRDQAELSQLTVILADEAGAQLKVSGIPVAPRTRLQDRGKTSAVLLLEGGDGGTRVPAELLQQRYGLNDREARLVRLLVQGRNLRQAAESMRVAYDTARWYAKGVYRKTGTQRQADLVRLVLRDFPAAVGGEPGDR